jgi:four helix bundle protein
MPLARQRGLANLRDQLLRAADSMVLNLAEGAGRLARDDIRRFYKKSTRNHRPFRTNKGKAVVMTLALVHAL